MEKSSNFSQRNRVWETGVCFLILNYHTNYLYVEKFKPIVYAPRDLFFDDQLVL
jgi:hypothetical protein